jgi:PAS domain-containing protein
MLNSLAGNAASTRHVRLDCQLVPRESDQIVLHVAITDISATKRAEKVLHEQDELFRLIAERLDGYIAVLDIDGRRVYNSPSIRACSANAIFFRHRFLHGSPS